MEPPKATDCLRGPPNEVRGEGVERQQMYLEFILGFEQLEW